MKKASLGFTLIELLVVIALLGILAVIAMPHFSVYRSSAFDSRALSDLRSAAMAEEAYFSDNEAYIACMSGSDCELQLPGFESSEGVNLAMEAIPAGLGTLGHFKGRSYHPKGARSDLGTAFVWNSLLGGLE